MRHVPAFGIIPAREPKSRPPHSGGDTPQLPADTLGILDLVDALTAGATTSDKDAGRTAAAARAFQDWRTGRGVKTDYAFPGFCGTDAEEKR